MRPSSSAPAAREHRLDSLADSLDRLNQEIRVLRNAIDEFRDEVSWLTRNGLPLQPIEHVTVKRMAKDPCATDWAERLELEHHSVALGAPRLEPASVQEIVDQLETTFEAVATGQLDFILPALDSVRNQIIEAIGKPPQSADHQSRRAPRSGKLFAETGDQRQLF